MVGDSLTGQTLATFAPPAHVTFWSVSASADDRTFVIQALSPAKPGEVLLWPYRGAGKITAGWYSVHLAPGTAQPARLTPLPIKPQSWISPSAMNSMYDPATTGVVSTAVSPSGREVAVLDVPAAGREEVKVFSLATGQLRAVRPVTHSLRHQPAHGAGDGHRRDRLPVAGRTGDRRRGAVDQPV